MTGLSTALTFVWLGLLLGISFIETPLKFRAPDIDVPRALGIGRLVFGALNIVEIGLAVALMLLVIQREAAAGQVAVLVLVVAALLSQIALIRPRLNRRTDRIIAGEVLQRSRLHLGYVVLEVAKVGLLITFGVLLAQA